MPRLCLELKPDTLVDICDGNETITLRAAHWHGNRVRIWIEADLRWGISRRTETCHERDADEK